MDVAGTADDWKGAYSEAVSVADDLGTMLESILERTMDTMDWLIAAPVRVDRWKRWRDTRPAVT